MFLLSNPYKLKIHQLQGINLFYNKKKSVYQEEARYILLYFNGYFSPCISFPCIHSKSFQIFDVTHL